ncbi:hypothetical protein D1007_28503 [Hordeum vulgare]|nr:hypothetical protein D1007_28503 [Hordeum vulgare]
MVGTPHPPERRPSETPTFDDEDDSSTTALQPKQAADLDKSMAAEEAVALEDGAWEATPRRLGEDPLDSCGSLLPASRGSPGASDASNMGLAVCPRSSQRVGSPLRHMEPTSHTLAPLPTLNGLIGPSPHPVEAARSPPRVMAGLPDLASHPPRPMGRPHSASSSATTTQKSARLVSSGLDGVSPNAIKKAARRAGLRNLDPGPSLDPYLANSIEDVSSSFSALVDVLLGQLDEIASDSTIVFRGEKGPAIEQLAPIQAKEILDGCLLAARTRVAMAAKNLTTPRLLACGEVGPLAPLEIRGRSRSRRMFLRRAVSASSASGSSVDPPRRIDAGLIMELAGLWE